MCTGRVDLAFILRAFSNGADGVFIGGCWPHECHYITEGNYLALSTVHLSKKILKLIGVNPERVRLEWISAAEGGRFAELMNDFSSNVKEMGSLGQGEGINGKGLRFKLDAAQSLVPYIKLVERERLRVPVKSEEEYNRFFNSDEFDILFDELIVDKLEINQIMAILREQPRTTGEITEILGMDPSDISRHLDQSIMQGIVKFDDDRNLMVTV
jgi:NADH-quinone oxidoreductase subunit E